MAGGKFFTTEAYDRLVELYKAHPDWKAKQFCQAVNNEFKSDWGLSLFQKKVAEITKADKERPPEKQGLDQIWSLASLVDYPIPPGAIPAVMSVYRKVLASKEELTVREVQWIARLYTIIDPPELLHDWAWAYSQEEWISEVTKQQPFGTKYLDEKLISDPGYAERAHTPEMRVLYILDIAKRYNADPLKLKDLGLSIAATVEVARSGTCQPAHATLPGGRS